MVAPASHEAASSTAAAVLPDRAVDDRRDTILRQYYTNSDFVVSPEGILKLISIAICILSAVLGLSGSICAGAPRLAAGAGAAALACSALAALLYAAALLGARACLYTDIILSTVMGMLLLIMATLTMTICNMNDFVSYANGLLGIVNACMLTGSAVIMYVSVMRLWDAAHARLEPAMSTPLEHDV